MSTGWDSRQIGLEGSSIARHEWKGLLKRRGGLIQRGELEDFVESREMECRERQFRMPGRISESEYDHDDDDGYFPEEDF
jgi:hypothetical protein